MNLESLVSDAFGIAFFALIICVFVSTVFATAFFAVAAVKAIRKDLAAGDKPKSKEVEE